MKKEKKKRIISFVAVAFRDAINFLSALLISSAEESIHSPIWCCALLMKDQDASLILLSGDLYSFGSPLNVTGKNLMPLTSSSSHTRSKKTLGLALGKFCQQSSAEVCGFLLLLTACGLLLLYFRSWCKTWKIKIWDEVPQSYLGFWGRQRIWISLAIFILSLVSSTLGMNLTPGIKIVIWEHFCLITLVTPISHKCFQPAALQDQLYLLADSPPHSAVSWKATAGQKRRAASSGAAGGIFQPLKRTLPRPRSWSNHGYQEFAAKTVPQILQTPLLDSELAWGMREIKRFLQCREGVVWFSKLLIKGTWSTFNVSRLNNSILASYVLSVAETWILFSSVLLCLQFLWRHKYLFATKVNYTFLQHFLFWPCLFFFRWRYL